MNQMPTYFGRISRVTREYLSPPNPSSGPFDHVVSEAVSCLEQMARDFAPLCDGGDNPLGDNQAQTSKYKRIIHAGKIIAAIKADMSALSIAHSSYQPSQREALASELATPYRFAEAIRKDSGIKRQDVFLGIGHILFYYAASLSLHDPVLQDFALSVRHLKKAQLQKLKKCMEFADKTDIFPLLGQDAKQAEKRYNDSKIKADENPFHQLVDAFIAKRTMDERTHMLTAVRSVRKR